MASLRGGAQNADGISRRFIAYYYCWGGARLTQPSLAMRSSAFFFLIALAAARSAASFSIRSSLSLHRHVYMAMGVEGQAHTGKQKHRQEGAVKRTPSHWHLLTCRGAPSLPCVP